MEEAAQSIKQRRKKGDPTLLSGSFRLTNDQSDLYFFIGTNDSLVEGLKFLGCHMRSKRKCHQKSGCIYPIPPTLPLVICCQPCLRLNGLEMEFELYYQGLILTKEKLDSGEKITRNYPHQIHSSAVDPKTFLFLDIPKAFAIKRVSLLKDFRIFDVDGSGNVSEVFLKTLEELEALLPSRLDVKDASSNTELLQPEEMEIEMSKDPLQEENSLFKTTHAETDCQGIDSNSIPSNASSTLARMEADYKMKIEILTRKNEEEKEKHQKDIQDLTNTIKSLLDGFSKLRIEFDQLKVERERAEAAVTALQEKVSDLENENKSLKEELTTMKSENSSLKEELSTMRVENKPFRDELSTMKTENNALRIELCTLKTENKSLKDDLSTLKTQKDISLEKKESEEEKNLSTPLIDRSRLEEMITVEEEMEERLEDEFGILTFQGIEKEERRLLSTLLKTTKESGRKDFGLSNNSEFDQGVEFKSKKVKKNKHSSVQQAQSEPQSLSQNSLSVTKSLFGDSFAPWPSTFSPDHDLRLPQKMEIDPLEIQREGNEADVTELKTLEEEEEKEALNSSEPDFSFINHFQKENRANILKKSQDLPSLKKDWENQLLAFQNGQDFGSLIVDAYLRARYGKHEKKKKKSTHWHIFESDVWTQIDSGKTTPLDYEVLHNKELLIFPMHISMEDYEKNNCVPIAHNPLKTRSHWVVIVIQNKTPEKKWWGPSFAVEAFYFDTLQTNSAKPPPFSFVPQILGYIGDCVLRMLENKQNQNPEISSYKNLVTGRPSPIDCAHNAYRVKLQEQATIYSAGLHALWNIDEVIANSCKHLCKTNEVKDLPQNDMFEFEKKMRDQVRKFVSIYLQTTCSDLDLSHKFVENHTRTRTPDFRRKITHTNENKDEAANAKMREETSVKQLANHYKYNLRAKGKRKI